MLRRTLTKRDEIPANTRNVKSRTLQFAAALVGSALWAQTALSATFTGTVFEDANYGGGVGRSLATSGGTPLANVRVELYRQSNGNYITAGNTNASGVYSLSSGTNSFAVIVRVVNGTVRSARTGGSTCTTCVPIQTYRTNAVSGTPVAVIDHVGGETPTLSDAATNGSSSSFNSLSTATSAAQSITTATPSGTGVTVSGIDFGFNFSTIVNTRDASSCAPTTGSPATFYPCQGSLRQFVINANVLGKGTLTQAGNGQIDGFTSSLPSSYESSIFMIPNGSANAGQNTGYSNQLTAGVAVISLTTTMTTVGAANTRLDATTQTVNVGNTNSGTQGTSGTVGVDLISFSAVPRPEVQINGGDTAITLSAANQHILGFALQQAYILLQGTTAVARHNLVGMSASGDSSTVTSGIGIAFQGTSALVRNNFVTVNNSAIRTDSGGSGSTIEYNEVARPTSGHADTFDGILLVGTVSNTTVRYNLARDQRGGGIEIGFGANAPASGITVLNNTIQNNGFTSGTTASTEPVGFVAYSFTGSNIVVSRNRIINNAGAGALVMTGTNVTISQNTFSNNGGLSIDLDARNLDPNSMTTMEGVTLNDTNDADGSSNTLLNFPVITSAYIIGTDLTINGFARPGATLELYLVSAADPTGFGEGGAYLGTVVEGSGSDLNAGTGSYGPAAINGVAQGQDNTNRFTFRFAVPSGVAIGSRLSATATLSGNTSEFGGNVVVTGGPSLLHVKSVQVISDPLNGATNPKSVPGSTQLYTIRVTNQGAGAIDADSIGVSDAIAANSKLFVGNIGGAGSGPIAFTNGTPSSGLTYTFTALNSTTDDLDFSNDNGVTWTYVPTADASGCDPAVTNIRVRPKGAMAGTSSGNPYFELRFRVLVR